jgi:protein TonB
VLLVAGGLVTWVRIAILAPASRLPSEAVRIHVLSATPERVVPAPVLRAPVPPPPRAEHPEEMAVPEMSSPVSAPADGSPGAGSADSGLGMEGELSPSPDAFGIVGRSPGVSAPNPLATETGAPGSGGGRSGGRVIDPAALEHYVQALSRRLSADQEYPRQAQIRGNEGTVLVQVRISAQARIIGVTIARSSGYALLDAEAVAKLQRLRALPSPPDGAVGRDFSVIVPIDFRLY